MKITKLLLAVMISFLVVLAYSFAPAATAFATDGDDGYGIDDENGVNTNGVEDEYINEDKSMNEDEYLEGDHSDENVPTYEYYDGEYHRVIDPNGNNHLENHQWKEDGPATWVDDEFHEQTYLCEDCGATKTEESIHTRSESEGSFKDIGDDTFHEYFYTCEECGGTVSELDWHEWYSYYDEYKKYNNQYHICVDEMCDVCGAVKGEKEAHIWNDTIRYNKIDGTYHSVKKTCDYCGAVVTAKAKHSTYKIKTIKKATLKKYGKIQYVCRCGAVIKTKSVPWKLGTNYSVSHNVTWNTNVYRSTKYVTVTLKNPVKGSKVIVKIGKKKYSKTVGKSKKVKVKIKKSKYGSKIYIDVKYKGKKIGEANYYDVVYYAKNIKKGLTKRQFKYTLNYWGAPDDTASASGGWSYWYYDDGSYIAFKNGKIRYWYDTAG